MAEGDEVGRPFRGLDGGDAGDAEHVALVVLAPPDEAERLRPHFDPAFRNGHPVGFVLGPHVDHVRRAVASEMGSARPPLYYRRGRVRAASGAAALFGIAT